MGETKPVVILGRHRGLESHGPLGLEIPQSYHKSQPQEGRNPWNVIFPALFLMKTSQKRTSNCGGAFAAFTLIVLTKGPGMVRLG